MEKGEEMKNFVSDETIKELHDFYNQTWRRDFRGKPCMVDGRFVGECIGQDWVARPYELSFQGKYGVFVVSADKVKIMSDQEFAELNMKTESESP
jgi:hypothetical protein